MLSHVTRRFVNPVVTAPSINSGREMKASGLGSTAGSPHFSGAPVTAQLAVDVLSDLILKEALRGRDVFLSGGHTEHG